MGLIAEAFTELLHDYARRKRLDYKRSVFGFGERIPAVESTRPFATGRLEEAIGRELARHYTQLTEAAAKMQQSMQIIELGLDYRQYARFVMITPEINRDSAGRLARFAPSWLPFTRDDYEFSRDLP